VVCGEKQSYRKIYARSFKASDTRPIVQQYNMKAGEMEENNAKAALEEASRPTIPKQVEEEEEEDTDWNQFVEDDYPNENQIDDDTVTTELKEGFRILGKRDEKWETIAEGGKGKKRPSDGVSGGGGRGKKRKIEEEPEVESAPPQARGRGRYGKTTQPSAFRPKVGPTTNDQHSNNAITRPIQPKLITQTVRSNTHILNHTNNKLSREKLLQATKTVTQANPSQRDTLLVVKPKISYDDWDEFVEPEELTEDIKPVNEQKLELEVEYGEYGESGQDYEGQYGEEYGGEYEGEYGEDYEGEYGEDYEDPFVPVDNFVPVQDDEL